MLPFPTQKYWLHPQTWQLLAEGKRTDNPPGGAPCSITMAVFGSMTVSYTTNDTKRSVHHRRVSICGLSIKTTNFSLIWRFRLCAIARCMKWHFHLNYSFSHMYHSAKWLTQQAFVSMGWRRATQHVKIPELLCKDCFCLQLSFTRQICSAQHPKHASFSTTF